MQRLRHWLGRPDLYLSPRVDLEALGPQGLFQVQTTATVIVLNCVIGSLVVVRNLSIGMNAMAAAVAITIAGGLGTLLLLRRTGNTRAAGWIGTSLMLMLLVVTNVVSGGFYDPNFAWFYIFPILAALLIDGRAGWLFTLIVLLLTLAFWAAPSLGIDMPDLIPPEEHHTESLINRVGAILVIGVALTALVNQQRFSGLLLSKANEDLRAEMVRREEASHRLMHAERMASMGTLAAGVAHEINNPLTYLVANVQLVQEQLERAEPGKERDRMLRDLLTEIHEGAERIKAINDDLSTFSRVDRNPSSTATPVSKAVDVAVRMAANEIRHRARLVCDYDDAPPVLAEEGRVVQILLNLLINAAHAIPDGSAADNEVRVTARLHGERVVVEVRDTGGGIAEGDLDRVFEPFFTTKPVGVGTGLGLPICRSLARAMGGDLTLESRLGGGTTARLTLPVADMSSDAADGVVEPAVSMIPEGIRILAIDDERAILRAVRRLLHTHTVSVASSAMGALELCEAEEYDVVLCDLMMPDLSGAEFYEHLRNTRPGYERRIVFMTGGVFTERMKEFVSTCGNPLIQKPFDVEILRRTISERARRRLRPGRAEPSRPEPAGIGSGPHGARSHPRGRAGTS